MKEGESTTRFLARRAGYWSPVITRGLLWIGIAILTDFRHSVAELAKKIAAGGTMSGLDWCDVLVGAGLAGFIAARLYLDQTLSQHVEEKKREGTAPPFETPLP